MRQEIDKDEQVARSIQEAWYRIEPWVMAEDGEMEKRIARRQEQEFRRPLRAFCVAIRANDHRVNDYHAEICPRHAISLEADAHPGRYAEHTVRLTDQLVEVACAPYHIFAPGERADDVARKLGCSRFDLRTLRRNGSVHVTPKPGLGGRRGHPVPLLYKRGMLDSTSRRKRGPDEDVFGTEWAGAHLRMPEGFSQTVTRVPRYLWFRGREQFRGWHWICPCCRRTANILYYPQPHPDLAVWHGWARVPKAWGQQHAPIFACLTCHGINWFQRCRLHNSWNELVLHYSGGLLYGHEVPKPAWLIAQPPRQRRPRPELPRRLELKRLLVTTTLPYPQLAPRLHMSHTAVKHMAQRIYKREGVKDREQLRQKLAPAHPAQSQNRMAG